NSEVSGAKSHPTHGPIIPKGFGCINQQNPIPPADRDEHMAEKPAAREIEWKSTACILCECNCGIEVQLGGPDGRRFVRVRGDDAHPASKGYACEKPLRLDFYQNGPHRLTKP